MQIAAANWDMDLVIWRFPCEYQLWRVCIKHRRNRLFTGNFASGANNIWCEHYWGVAHSGRGSGGTRQLASHSCWLAWIGSFRKTSIRVHSWCFGEVLGWLCHRHKWTSRYHLRFAHIDPFNSTPCTLLVSLCIGCESRTSWKMESSEITGITLLRKDMHNIHLLLLIV